jgi:hypothetical protein
MQQQRYRKVETCKICKLRDAELVYTYSMTGRAVS